MSPSASERVADFLFDNNRRFTREMCYHREDGALHDIYWFDIAQLQHCPVPPSSYFNAISILVSALKLPRNLYVRYVTDRNEDDELVFNEYEILEPNDPRISLAWREHQTPPVLDIEKQTVLPKRRYTQEDVGMVLNVERENPFFKQFNILFENHVKLMPKYSLWDVPTLRTIYLYSAYGVRVPELAQELANLFDVISMDGERIYIDSLDDKNSSLVTKLVEANILGGKFIFPFAPVEGDFNLRYKVDSLVGCPEKVGGNFDISNLNIKSLQGGPIEVGGNFNAANTILSSLEGSPKRVGGKYHITQLDSSDLNGISRHIGGDLYVGFSKVSCLAGFPDFVGGDIIFEICEVCDISNLPPAPEKGVFVSSISKMFLNYWPVKVNGSFMIFSFDSGIQFTNPAVALPDGCKGKALVYVDELLDFNWVPEEIDGIYIVTSKMKSVPDKPKHLKFVNILHDGAYYSLKNNKHNKYCVDNKDAFTKFYESISMR